MSNQPERTCIICKSKKEKSQLFRIVEKDGIYVLDEKQIVQSRGQYICKEHNCLNRLSKHKKIKVSIEDLLKMINLLKKESKDYLKILKAMKNSQELVFGINMILEEIEKINFVVIATDISERNNRKLIDKLKEKNISYVHYGNKSQLGEIFGKDEINVIAIKNKKVARGLIENSK
ncbi:MAG: DUF448 domain-containing protein [Fusobacterium perfoetens]|uniref:DUF448 domain-containing protein n=1 Tax=Fusobacterium perfoetens TaxID=852 RepID=UPI0023F49DC7|nr:DUF448 domain-containing protein [Fusobacterium perfoetens]MCI6152779.1 DUF448 domain-containing protein [Fusobacterium perfoetens]MDY3236673.1 DUF448 domain-containing protein [Fusobacterium perfoetens]